MTAITLTERAARRIRELLDGVDDRDGLGLRIAVQPYGWTQRYGLSLGPGPDDGEDVIRLDDVEVFVAARTAALVDGVRIDYVQIGASAGFTFHNSRPGPPVSPPGETGERPAPHRPMVEAGGGEADLRQRVEDALAEVRSFLWRDGGDAVLVGVGEDTAWIELEGACSGCAASESTVIGLIQRSVSALVPEITKVRVAR